MSDLLDAAKIIATAIDGLAAAYSGSGAAKAQPAKEPKGTKDSPPAAQPDPKPATPKVDPEKYETVKALILKVNKDISREAVTALFADYKTETGGIPTKGPELQVADYDDFIAKAQKVLEDAAANADLA